MLFQLAVVKYLIIPLWITENAEITMNSVVDFKKAENYRTFASGRGLLFCYLVKLIFGGYIWLVIKLQGYFISSG